MGISKQGFIETNLKYHSGIAVDVYGDEYSIVAAIAGEDDKVFMRWSYPQKRVGGANVPNEKAIPHKITLGNKGQAIQRLEQLIHIIEAIA